MTMLAPLPRPADWSLPSLTRRLPSDVRSPRSARTLVHDALDGYPPDTVATAQLLVSELVTNAVLHAKPPILLEIYLGHPLIRVGVTDRSVTDPLTRSASVDANTGRGLPLVEALASACGWFRSGGGKTVWFELSGMPCPSSGVASEGPAGGA